MRVTIDGATSGDSLTVNGNPVAIHTGPPAAGPVVAEGSIEWPVPNVPNATNDVDIVNAKEAHILLTVTKKTRIQYGGGNAPNAAQPVQMWVSIGAQPNGGHVQDAFSSGNNFANAGGSFDAEPGDYNINFFTLDGSGITGNIWVNNG
jgi:hypothetical protein